MKELKLNIQLFASGTTKLENMVDPEVMAPMITAKIEKAIVATPFAKIDTTLVGQPGSTITVPRYKYIGEAEDVAEGVTAGTVKLETDTDTYTVKKAMKAVTLTDEAILSGYGNPVGEANSQLGKAIAEKIDNDVMDELKGAQNTVTLTGDISYDNVVNALDRFNEEENVPKVMFIHPKQVTQLRKDDDFISNDKYNNNVMLRGEIGMIANTRIVATKKAISDDGAYFLNPIVQLRAEAQTGDDELAAVTIFMKKGANVETERHTLNRTTDISVDEHYIAALTDETKVVLAKFDASAVVSL
jgi:N4-gp56 family major capsid protein